MAGFNTQYQRLNSNEDPEEDLPPQGFHINTRGVGEHEKGELLEIVDSKFSNIIICNHANLDVQH